MNKLLSGKDFWNTTAPQYSSGKTNGRSYVLDPSLLKVLGDVKGKRILDVGCGPGDISIRLAQKGAHCVGIDFSKEMIKIAKDRASTFGLNIEFKCLDVRDIYGLESPFDVALIICLLPHFSLFKDIVKVIQNVSRRLAVRGRLIVAEPHPAFDVYMRERLSKGEFHYFHSGLPYRYTMHIDHQSLASAAYHWTLHDYVRSLSAGGFVIREILEPQPTRASRTINPQWFNERSKYPPYIIFDCIKRTDAP